MRILSLLALLGCAGPSDDSGETAELAQPAPLSMVSLMDINAVVATKGMDVADDGTVWLWNYNQDELQSWDGNELATVGSGLVTSFGTDLAVLSGGDVVVSKGDSGSGDVLMRWSPDGQTPWSADGLRLSDALAMGLHVADFEGSEALWLADAGGSEVRVLAASDGAERATIGVSELPLDVAVLGERLFVLTSSSTNPLGDSAVITLRAYDLDGTELASTPVVGGSYLAVSAGLVFVSTNDFDAASRSIAAFSADLQSRVDTELPASYVGFAGGIAGRDGRVYVLGQEGTGSDPICDVLVYE